MYNIYSCNLKTKKQRFYKSLTDNNNNKIFNTKYVYAIACYNCIHYTFHFKKDVYDNNIIKTASFYTMVKYN